MAGLPRSAPVAPARRNNMRPPNARPSSNRSQSAIPPSRIDRSGAISPAESVASMGTITTGMKRKERDFEQDEGQETNINVVVRCRGRNEREVRENSGVVLSTDGAKGRTVELSMGPSALSNKTYHFDRVFSPAADQSMIYDDVVTPLLDEMLAGYNCTIFAYGQTGTGKTYTMSGDMSHTHGMLSDAAGIIPRVLYSLFNKLELSEAESSVKCSFIELYNEELRDLLSVDDGNKLKIFEDNSKKGHAATFVQGMEESHIKSAADGVKLLQEGSHKRQVAATKCNDLSSRSHTVFTVTAYIKQTGDNGEDYISAGKLNLVDLAGSENIQRSGAENKRAAEAGLINKSLLTLGRVINALVDKGSHIPYRESKLTRLLQDSLGGRTRTTIIATVSPAKSNLEETISTLDYAFRAKNIRNKPQVNQVINKKTLLKEFTSEIEKLKSELIATRQRNGVYLTAETYEEMTVESESRRILNEEQGAKIETMEANLRNKVQELFSMTSNLLNLKKDHELTRTMLDESRDLLEQTELVLSSTRQSLAEEEMLRKAHQDTEEKLSVTGTQLISTLNKTVSDVGGLHSKLRRRSDLQSLNRGAWGNSQTQVSKVTTLVEARVEEFKSQQEGLMAAVSSRMQSFIEDELLKLSASQAFLSETTEAFTQSEQEAATQSSQAKEQMDQVLEEIKTLREDVKGRVKASLEGLSVAAQRISAEVLGELGQFHSQLHGSYSSLGRDFKNMFEELIKHIYSQKAEADDLRRQLSAASERVIEANAATASKLDMVLLEEQEQSAAEREDLLAQITKLVTAQSERQEARLKTKIGSIQSDVVSSKETFEAARITYSLGMDAWNQEDTKLVEEVLKSRETLKTKLKDDWLSANKHHTSLQTATKSIHEETVRIVDEQMKDIGVQMQTLDDFVTRARSQNAEHHESHSQTLRDLSSIIKGSYTTIGSHLGATCDRVKDLGDEISAKSAALTEALSTLDSTIREPLAQLRSNITSTTLQEYIPTGETPQKTLYQYPTELQRTAAHETLLANLRRPAVSTSPLKSPSKSQTIVFNDEMPAGDDGLITSLQTPLLEGIVPSGLREIDANINTVSQSTVTEITVPDLLGDQDKGEATSRPPLFKRSVTGSSLKIPQKIAKKPTVVALEGRENTMVSIFSQSTGRRRSPRNGGS